MKWLRGMPEPPAETMGANMRLEDIFRQFSGDLRRYVRRRMRQSADAQDLTQEIFERFIQGERHLSARDPHAYLFGIASHMIAEVRMAERRSVVTYDSEAFDKAAEALPAEGPDALEGMSVEDELTFALDRLPDVQRIAILLTKRDGLSCKEAALKMGTTEGSVRVYVCAARAQLKRMLKSG